MDTSTAFITRVLDELWRSLGEAFGVLNYEGQDVTGAFADVLTRFIVSLLLVLIFYIAYQLLRRGLQVTLNRIKLPVPPDIKKQLFVVLRYVALLLGSLAVLSQFGVSGDLLSSAGIAAVFAFLFYLGWIIGNKVMTNSMRTYNFDRSLEQLFRNVFTVVIGALAIVTVLGQFGINVVSVIAALGVVGIAVGFAAQETLSNFIAGITLLVERPFRIGEWVEINGQVGRVEEITLRTTRLVTRDNILASIPNASVTSSDIKNFSGGGPLRVHMGVGIAYKENAQRARDIMLPVLQAHPKVLSTPNHTPAILMSELADSSVNLDLLYWINPDDIGAQPAISAQLLERCKEVLDDAGIEIPFPHLQLFVDDAKGLLPVIEPFIKRSA